MRNLVLVHENEGPFTGTDSWLSRRAVAGHFHVRRRQPEDFARLARLLTSESTSIVLSGGGARGLAHIGVLSGLIESGVTIDAIAGQAWAPSSQLGLLTATRLQRWLISSISFSVNR